MIKPVDSKVGSSRQYRSRPARLSHRRARRGGWRLVKADRPRAIDRFIDYFGGTWRVNGHGSLRSSSPSPGVRDVAS